MTNHEIRTLMIGLWARLDAADRDDFVAEITHYHSDPAAYLPVIALAIRDTEKLVEDGLAIDLLAIAGRSRTRRRSCPASSILDNTEQIVDKPGHDGGSMRRVAKKYSFDRDGDIFLRRLPTGDGVVNVPVRVMHHSPSGIEWGYAGSGPADLALNILDLYLRRRRRGDTGIRVSSKPGMASGSRLMPGICTRNSSGTSSSRCVTRAG